MRLCSKSTAAAGHSTPPTPRRRARRSGHNGDVPDDGPETPTVESAPAGVSPRRRVSAARAVSVVVAVLLGVRIGWRLAVPEPSDLDTLLGDASIFAFVAPVVVPLFVLGVWRRDVLVAGLPALALTSFVGAVLWADDVHWWLSRSDFEQFVAGTEPDCGDGGDCRIGWWHAVDSTRLDSLAILWFDDEDCHMGFGLAHPVGRDPGEAAVRDVLSAENLRSTSFSVHRWRDGWYRLCFYTS